MKTGIVIITKLQELELSLKQEVLQAVLRAYDAGEIKSKISASEFNIQVLTDEQRGQYATNAAFVLSAKETSSPGQLAQTLTRYLPQKNKHLAAVAQENGFINFQLNDACLLELLDSLITPDKANCVYPGSGKLLVSYTQDKLHNYRLQAVSEVFASLFINLRAEVSSTEPPASVTLHLENSAPQSRLIAPVQLNMTDKEHLTQLLSGNGDRLNWDAADKLFGPGVLRFNLLKVPTAKPVALALRQLGLQSLQNDYYAAQYIYSRVFRVLNRVKTNVITEQAPLTASERALSWQLCQYPHNVMVATKYLEPSILTSYIIAVAVQGRKLLQQVTLTALDQRQLTILQSIEFVLVRGFGLLNLTPQPQM